MEEWKVAGINSQAREPQASKILIVNGKIKLIYGHKSIGVRLAERSEQPVLAQLFLIRK